MKITKPIFIIALLVFLTFPLASAFNHTVQISSTRQCANNGFNDTCYDVAVKCRNFLG